MDEVPNALVVWGSTGRRLNFSRDDLAMPPEVSALPNAHFYRKQWPSVAGFWFTRVLKESALQHLTVEEVVGRIQNDIAHRWERRRAETARHKKRQRLMKNGGPAGDPAPRVVVTNVVALEEFMNATAPKKTASEGVKEEKEKAEGQVATDAAHKNPQGSSTAADAKVASGESESFGEEEWKTLLAAIIEHATEAAGGKAPLSSDILVDTSGSGSGGEGNGDNKSNTGSATDTAAAPATKKARVEDASGGSVSRSNPDEKHDAPPFDDRVAVVLHMGSADAALEVIMAMHGKLLNGRQIICRFFGPPA